MDSIVASTANALASAEMAVCGSLSVRADRWHKSKTFSVDKALGNNARMLVRDIAGLAVLLSRPTGNSPASTLLHPLLRSRSESLRRRCLACLMQAAGAAQPPLLFD